MTARLVAAALKFATKAHEGQKRKYTGEPYINHPKSVAARLKERGHPSYVIAAALLHDVVEDCGVSIEAIREKFGVKVARLVGEVTDVSTPADGNRDVRKALDREHYGRASRDGKSIKLADMIDNSESIMRHDASFAHQYLQEKRLLLPLLKGGDAVLHRQADRIVTEAGY